MTSSSRRYEVDLPPDFTSFIQSNYEKIFAIRQKIKEFYEQSREGEFFRKRRSISDLTSEAEECSPIIKAKIKFKPHVLQKLDTVEIGSDYLSQWQRVSLRETEGYEYADISRKFPSLVLSATARREWGCSEDTSLLVEGISIKLVSRVARKPKTRKYFYHQRPGVKRSSRVQWPTKSFKGFLRKNPDLVGESSEGQRLPFLPSLQEIAWDIYSRLTSDENVTFPQLVFPPLHSSVLALLSQRSTLGNQTLRAGTAQQGLGSSVTKQKASQSPTLFSSSFTRKSSNLDQNFSTFTSIKLRRHGRRRKNGSQEKLATEGEGTEGEHQEHQVTGGDKEAEATRELEGKEGSHAEKNEEAEAEPFPSNPEGGTGRQLYQILDETLSRTKWYLTVSHSRN